MRLHRPIGALLLLWPTLWALWLAAGGSPRPSVAAIFIAGVFLMRAAGCVVNDFADRNIDAHVARTRDRPLARGDISPRAALVLFALLLLPAAALALQLRAHTQLWAAAALPIAALYPFCKRVLRVPQLVLGVAFSWGIPMAYAELQGGVPAEAWLLFAANFAWVLAYDTQYAMADRADDARIGVHSSAIFFGRRDHRVVTLCYAACLLLLGVLGARRGLAAPFYAGLGAAAVLAACLQFACKTREHAACFRAFLRNNWFGAAVFCGIAAAFAL